MPAISKRASRVWGGQDGFPLEDRRNDKTLWFMGPSTGRPSRAGSQGERKKIIEIGEGNRSC